MVFWAAMSLTVYLCLCPILFVDGAFDMDANRRFMYSIHRNWKQVFEHPSMEKLLGLPRDVTLKEMDTITTAQGVRRCRMQQMYKGYKLIGAGVEADIDFSGRYDKGVVTGKIVLGIKDDLKNDTCNFDKDAAVSRVLQKEGFDGNAALNSQTVTKNVFFKNKHAHFVYAVTLAVGTASADKRPYYIIDCRTGEVLYHDERSQEMVVKRQQDATPAHNTPPPTTPPPSIVAPVIKCSAVNGFGGNEKVGKIDYSKSTNCLLMTVEGEFCVLENKLVKTVHMKNTRNLDLSTPFRFRCSEGANDAINGAYSPLLDAHSFGTSTIMMFMEWYKTKPLKFQAVMMVHFKKNYEGAHWHGRRMLFGDGFNYFYPLVAADVIAHEMAHGVTEFSSNLNYNGQSGGMNEAFSDMAGEVAEAYLKSADYLVGFSVLKARRYALRYFKDPTLDGLSIKLAKNFREYMDVHQLSGVYNHVFYRVASAGNIDIRYAFEAFLTANKIYWKSDTDFQGGVCGVMRGAYDNGLDFNLFGDAFEIVGLTACQMGMYIEKLTAREPRIGLTVSSIRQSLFGIKTVANTNKIILTASGMDIKIALQSSLKRSSILAEGVGMVQQPVSGAGQYYVRIFTDSDVEIKDVSIGVKFE